MSERKGWWYRASQAEKLAQIDGAIDLGMTAKQCAMNCGCVYESIHLGKEGITVATFAMRHGRHFNGQSVGAQRSGFAWDGEKLGSKRQAHVSAAKSAYLAGEPVDFWSVK